MSDITSETETIRFAFNGRRFAREAERYCQANGLACSWANDGRLPWRLSLTSFVVTGTPAQLRAFIEWGDRHRPGLAAPFDGEPFMTSRRDRSLA
jgi:hypothetical protein